MRRVARGTVTSGLRLRAWRVRLALLTLALGTLAAAFLLYPRILRPLPSETSAVGAAVRVTVKPATPYIESGHTGQHLNCDFLLDNLTDEELVLTDIELRVFNNDGSVVRRDFVNRASRPSLEIEPDRVLPSRGSLLVFNPFHSIAPSVPLTKLRFSFAFEDRGHRMRHTSTVDVLPVAYQTMTSLVLPLKGRVLVWDGHDARAHHRRLDYTVPAMRERHITSNFQRYGYDFVLVDDHGGMTRGAPEGPGTWYRGEADDNTAYFGFGQPVCATGAGRVVDAHDGEPDNRRVDPAEFAKRETALGGNYVVIDHLNGEFSWFGHMKRGSVAVAAGQSVRQGEMIGRIGASGDALFPHLHYELRTAPGITDVEGLPSYFSGFTRPPSSTLIERGQVDTGDILENR